MSLPPHTSPIAWSIHFHHVTSQSRPERQDLGTTTLRGNTLASWRAMVLTWRSVTMLAPWRILIGYAMPPPGSRPPLRLSASRNRPMRISSIPWVEYSIQRYLFFTGTGAGYAFCAVPWQAAFDRPARNRAAI